jgi:hypothetical protein
MIRDKEKRMAQVYIERLEHLLKVAETEETRRIIRGEIAYHKGIKDDKGVWEQ